MASRVSVSTKRSLSSTGDRRHVAQGSSLDVIFDKLKASVWNDDNEAQADRSTHVSRADGHD